MSIKVGDCVQLMSWEKAVSLYATRKDAEQFNTASGLYIPIGMKKYFGQPHIVSRIIKTALEDYTYFEIEDDDDWDPWTFSSELIEFDEPVPNTLPFSFDDFINGGGDQ